MLYGFLLGIYVFIAVVLLLLILVQQTKSSMGLGTLGGGTQMLFGGSGGQNFFQKISWILGISFMALSMILAIMKSTQLQTRYLVRSTKKPIVYPIEKSKKTNDLSAETSANTETEKEEQEKTE